MVVQPHLEYGNIIWYPHLNRQSVAVEKVQHRATKLLKKCRGVSYTDIVNVWSIIIIIIIIMNHSCITLFSSENY